MRVENRYYDNPKNARRELAALNERGYDFYMSVGGKSRADDAGDPIPFLALTKLPFEIVDGVVARIPSEFSGRRKKPTVAYAVVEQNGTGFVHVGI